MKNRIIFFILSIFTFTPIFAQYVSSLAGAGAAGFKDATGVLAQFAYPQATAVDTAGNIFVADFGNHCIRKITKDGMVSTFAGTPQASGLINGPALQSKFYNPSGIALDDSGNVYVSDCQNNCIRKITKTTMLVSTLAGSSTSGANNGQGSAASFSKPQGIAIDGGRNIFVADLEKNLIRKITPSGLVSTIAGNGSAGFKDATGTAAQFNKPQAVAIDAQGNILVADLGNYRIRKIDQTGVVTTFLGKGTSIETNATGILAGFLAPNGITINKTSGDIYITDGQKIRKSTLAGVVSTYAGNGTLGLIDGALLSAQFASPMGLSVDKTGNVYVADNASSVIRKVNLTGNLTVTNVSPVVDLDADNSSGGAGSQYFANIDNVSTPIPIVDIDLKITDADNTTLSTAIISLNNTKSGYDNLSIEGILPTDITSTINISSTSGISTVILSGTATIADYITALKQVRFSTSNNTKGGTRYLQIIVSDGTSNSTQATVKLTIKNVAPVLKLDANNSSGSIGNDYQTSFTEGGNPISIVDNDISITDSDNTTLISAIVTLTNTQVADEVSIVSTLPNGITSNITNNGSNTILTLAGISSFSNYQNALKLIQFKNSSSSPSTVNRNISIVINDGTSLKNGTNSDSIATAYSTIKITSFNNTPVIDLDADNNSGQTGNDFQISYNEGSTPIQITDTDLSIIDNDSPTLSKAGIIITNKTIGDTLIFKGTLPASLSTSTNKDTLFLSGNGTIGEYIAAIRSIQYYNYSSIPKSGDRNILVKIGDGIDKSNAAYAIIHFNILYPNAVLSSTGTLNSFSTNIGTPSDIQKFEITAEHLKNALTIAAPTGFEISTNTTGNFLNTITLTAQSGLLINVPIYVRLKAYSNAIEYPANAILITDGNSQTTVSTPLSSVFYSSTAPQFVFIQGSFCEGQNLSIKGINLTQIVDVRFGNIPTTIINKFDSLIVVKLSNPSMLTDTLILKTNNNAILKNKYQTIINPKPALNFNFPNSVCLNDSKTIKISFINHHSNFKWYANNNTKINIANADSVNLTFKNIGDSFIGALAIDSLGCMSDTIKNKIVVNNLPAPPTTTNVNYCSNSTPTALIANGYQLLWWGTNATGGTAIAATPTPNISNIGTTSYYVSQKDVNGCESERAKLDVTVTGLPSGSFNYTTPICKNANNPSATLVAGSIAGTFSSTAGLVFSNTTTGQINLLSSTAGTYTITNTIATSGGCPVVSSTSSITIAPVPTSTIVTTTQTICSGTAASISTTLTGTAPWSVTYSDASTSTTISNISTSPYIYQPVPSANKKYSVNAISDKYNCTGTQSGQLTVNLKAIPTATISGNQAICAGGTATLSIALTGTQPWGLTYYDGVTQTSIANINASPYTFTVSPTIAKTYTLSAVNDAQCNGTPSGSATVTMTTAPTATIVSGNTTICNGSTANISTTLTGTAPWTIKYTDGTTFVSIPNITSSPYSFPVSPTSNKTFTLSAVNAGCDGSVSGSYIVNVNKLPTASITGTDSIHLGDSTNLSVSLTGTSPWKITYSDGINSKSISGITTSPYLINVKPPLGTNNYHISSISDANCNGDTNTLQATISVYPIPNVTIAAPNSINLGDSATFNLTLTGVAPYSIIYSDGTTNDTISGITTNTYSFKTKPSKDIIFNILSISDALGDTVHISSQTVSITVIQSAIITQPKDILTCNSIGSKFIIQTIAGYNIQWQKKAVPFDTKFTDINNDQIFKGANNDTLTLIENIGNTEFRCIVNNKDTSNIVKLNVPIVPTPKVTSPINYCAGANTNSLNASTTNIKYSLLWWGTDTSAATSFTIPTKPNNIITTKYYVSQKDTNGCESKKAEILVNINSLPTVTHTGSDSTIVCQGSPASTKLNFTGTSPWTLNYSLNNNEFTLNNINTSSFTIIANIHTSGSYPISINKITDSNECVNISNIKGVIIVEKPVNASFSYAGNPYCKTETTASPITTSTVNGSKFTCLNPNLKIDSTTGQIDINASQADSYVIINTVNSTNVCPNDVKTQTITIGNPPTASLKLVASTNKSIEICKGASVDMDLTWSGNGPLTIYYDNGTEKKDTIIPNILKKKSIIAKPKQTITYKLLSISDSVCTSPVTLTDSINVIVKPTGDRTSIPILSQSGGYDCQNNTLKIVVKNDTLGAKYQWYRNGRLVIGDTLKEISIFTYGDYSVNNGTCYPSEKLNINASKFDTKPQIKFYNIDTDHSYLKTDSVEHDTFQWYFNEYKVQGATNQNLEILYNGNYKVNVNNKCNLISDIYEHKSGIDLNFRKGIVFNADSSISFIDNSLPYSIAPNPSNSFIHITGNEIDAEYTITISDLAGAILIQQSNNLLVNKEINIQSLASGLYLSEIKVNNHSYFTKIVKQ